MNGGLWDAWRLLCIPVAELGLEGCDVVRRAAGLDNVHASLESKTARNYLSQIPVLLKPKDSLQSQRMREETQTQKNG